MSQTEERYMTTVRTDTQYAIFIDHMKSKSDVKAYMAECKMLFELLGKQYDRSTFS